MKITSLSLMLVALGSAAFAAPVNQVDRRGLLDNLLGPIDIGVSVCANVHVSIGDDGKPYQTENPACPDYREPSDGYKATLPPLPSPSVIYSSKPAYQATVPVVQPTYVTLPPAPVKPSSPATACLPPTNKPAYQATLPPVIPPVKPTSEVLPPPPSYSDNHPAYSAVPPPSLPPKGGAYFIYDQQ
ncbi:hypothetical protein EV182_000171 [Spiromyces aspiralis]|uniref:Uncharacterized protein n=1 Tax=Spiromyces aspiralis TaxID=68401 RepID=A0ACC1HKW3_9FUNG|nr:hypothetical protein EV182_000171 [Spiromyces aspiralis]